ncbi:MAG TPA: hypothetical protein VGD54_17895, partial [Steroidobacteraceae bacterium]
RESVVRVHPRSPRFKEEIIQTFYDGIKHKPDTTFGNVKADVLADKDPKFRRGNFCSVIRGSAWRDESAQRATNGAESYRDFRNSTIVS